MLSDRQLCREGEQFFVHSGDIGDILYALPAIKACGGGKLFITHTHGKTSHGMTEEKVARLAPLLELQPFIYSVCFDINTVGHNLDGFRSHKVGTLVDAHLSTVGKSWEERMTPWISNIIPNPAYDVLVHRSFRYRNDKFPWQRIVDKYKHRIGFIGFEDEYKDFCSRFGTIPFVVAENFLVLAEFIAGSQLFIGNQSSPLAVAHGLFHPTITEVSIGFAQNDCWFQRINHIFGWDERVICPELV